MLQKKYRQFFLSALAIVVPALLLFFCLRKFDLHLFARQMEEVRWSFLAFAFLLPAGILWAQSLQWQVFLPPDRKVPLLRMFNVTSLFSMLVNTVPFWGGHAFAVYLLGVREKVGKTAALSVITLEQIADGFAKLVIFAGIAFFYPFPEWMRAGVKGFVLLVLTVYLVLLLLAFRFRDHPEMTGLFKPIGWRRLFAFAATWAHHLHALRSFKKMVGGIFLAVLMKSGEALAIYWVQKAFGLNLPFYAPWVILGALSLATMLPLSPGRLGVFEATLYFVYQSFGVEPTLALTLGLFIHLAHTLPFILIGYGVSLKLGFKKKEIPSASKEAIFLAGSEV
jgi:uncharacterized protein (TIRG00374 family)